MSIRQVIPAPGVTLNRRSHLSGDNGHRGWPLRLPGGARREPEEAGRKWVPDPDSPGPGAEAANRATSRPARYALPERGHRVLGARAALTRSAGAAYSGGRRGGRGDRGDALDAGAGVTGGGTGALADRVRRTARENRACAPTPSADGCTLVATPGRTARPRRRLRGQRWSESPRRLLTGARGWRNAPLPRTAGDARASPWGSPTSRLLPGLLVR